MSHAYNFALLIYENIEWNTLKREDLVCLANSISHMVMGQCFPALVFDPVLESLKILIDTHTVKPDLVTPLVPVFCENFLILLHWFLAWTAPRGPEVQQDNLSFFMDKSSPILAHFLLLFI